MKAVKRQTRASGIETEQNEANERKKAKLAACDDDSPMKSLEVQVDKSTQPELNGDQDQNTQTDPVVLKLPPMKTSTPLVHNGSVHNLIDNFNDTSAIAQDSSFPSPMVTDDNESVVKELSEEVYNGGSDDKVELPKEPEVPAAMSTNDTEGQTNGESLSLPINNDLPLEFNGTEEVSILSDKVESDNVSKCDVDIFLSSLLEASVLEGHADRILAVAADEDIVVSASQDTTIKMWDPHKKEELCNFQGHTDSVNALLLLSVDQSIHLSDKMGFVGTKRIVVSGSTDCSIRLWSVPDGIELTSIYTYNGITSLGYMENQNCIAVGTDGGKLELWEMCTSKVLHSIVAHDGPVTDMKVDDLYIYTTSSDGKVKVWLLDDDELLAIYTRSRKVPSVEGLMCPADWRCVSAAESQLYLGDNTSDIKILNWKAGRLRMLRNQNQPQGMIEAICVKNNVLLSSSYDQWTSSGAINVWQLPSMTYICTMHGEDVGRINSLSFTLTKEGILRVVSGGSKLVMWDYIPSKAPSTETDGKFFCREMEHLGEDTSLKAEPSKVAPPVEKKKDEVDGAGTAKSKCTLI